MQCKLLNEVKVAGLGLRWFGVAGTLFGISMYWIRQLVGF